MARVKVTDPFSGAVVEVEHDSALAARWARVEDEKKPEPAGKPATSSRTSRKKG